MQTSLWLSLMVATTGVLSGYLAHVIIARMRETSATWKARNQLEDARREAEVLVRDARIKAKEEILAMRGTFEEERKTRRKDLLALEERLAQREATLDRKLSQIERREQILETKQEDVDRQKEILMQKESALNTILGEQRQALERLSGLTQEEAHRHLMEQLEQELQHEAGTLIRRVQEETRHKAEREARKIITAAIERYAADQTNQVTSCVVPLPSDEMKGRIIGREGRNIRALEAITGVNILIDETPEIVVISGFDPVRREVARITLETLINDGRIHPARIEEVHAKVESELEENMRLAGEEAVYSLGLQGVAPEIVRAVGRLRFRHSYGQNVLTHSMEMGHILGAMAAELGLDAAVARRIGLFHDIGKGLDQTGEGGHALRGADLLRKHGESATVVNAVAAHHNDIEGTSIYAALTRAADAITASRPGARSETTEIYLKRLENLERIASRFRGVEKVYAIQAGREVRVIVSPTQVDDEEAMQMARNISKEIEDEMEYPGQIKVTVVRETRCIEYAR